MDAVPLVVDNVEVCADAPQVRASVEETVRLAIARGARLRVVLDRSSKSGTQAHATLTLADDVVESRDFVTTSHACASLVRAMGAWVTVRMDEWSERAEADAHATTQAKVVGVVYTTAAPPVAPPPEAQAEPATSGLDANFDVDREGHRIADPAGPEISVASSLVGGLLPQATLVGASAGATLAMSDTVVLRGGLFAYTAAVTTDFAFGHRMDVCRRFPGRYARFHGLALDVCGGAEIGALNRELYGAAGPSLMIHGDLTRSLSLDLGGGVSLPFGASVQRSTEEQRGLVVATRGDLGLSWRLP